MTRIAWLFILVIIGSACTSSRQQDAVNLSVEQMEVEPGGMVTVTWNAPGYETVALRASLGDYRLFQDYYSEQPAQGTTTINIPDHPSVYDWQTQIELVGISDEQTTFLASHPLHVTCPFIYFWGGEGCPLGESYEVDAILQYFEHGMMLFRDDTDNFYVLFDDGSAGLYVTETLPVSLTEPPTGLSMPDEPFRSMWLSHPSYLESLGWATDSATTYTMTEQRAHYPYGRSSGAVTFYISLPEGEVLELNGGYPVPVTNWQIVLGT